MLENLMADLRRVYCLYRVSTLGQVEKDDIPMQKQYCREFVGQHPGWEIIKEFSEKGVSGFKVSAKDRDAIQEIQRDALQNKFDILLVFMFDRLGRREDETPFVVEWFVKNGIEVWSAKEGQQRFDTHVDKLLNYIRYGVEKLDKLVDQIIRIQLGRIQNSPSQELIEKQQAKEVELVKSRLNLLNEQYRQKQREYQDLRAETIKVIQGTSRLNADLLNSLVSETTEQIKQLGVQIQTTTAELEETVQTASQVLREYDQLISWAEMYDHCTFEAKKMIVAKFVKAVRVRRDYEIDIEFNVSFEEFQALYLEGEPEEAKRPGTNTILAMETKK